MTHSSGGLRELALFAGAGGGLLGTSLLGWHPVCAVEYAAYPREVLLRRQRDGLLPLFPVWDDARTFDGHPWRGCVDVVTGGFPCQPFSTAGKRLADDDPRNGWPWTHRILGEVRPRLAFLENVAALLTHDYFGTILGDLAALGYDGVWDCVPASAVGAPHRRDRLWLLAYPAGLGHGGGRGERDLRDTDGRPDDAVRPESGGASAPTGDVADACGAGLEGHGEESSGGGWWATERRVGRMADGLAARLDRADPTGSGNIPRVVRGLPHRTHRLMALGNGQVPAVVVRAWQTLAARAGL